MKRAAWWAITHRAPILIATFAGFTPAYRMVAWLCWVPNLLVAETKLLAERRSRLEPVAGL